MLPYFAGVCQAGLSFIFVVSAIGALGYLVGGIKVKGIELGTAGVLLIAIVYGILAHVVPQFSIAGRTITLFNAELKADFGIVSNIGTALFVTAVGLIAGPKFFRSFHRATLCYILLGFIVIAIGAFTTVLLLKLDGNLSKEMAVGLLTGALTSTPGLSAAKEAAASVAGSNADHVVAGYGIAYVFGVLGVVLFVQLTPKILKVNMEDEVAHFKAANAVNVPALKGTYIRLDPLGLFPFMLAIAFGCIIGAFYIPGINFSLGKSGGTLIGGLIIGHFAHIGRLDCRVSKETLSFMRELGLALFLIGAGVPGGVNFMANARLSYFIYGAVMTTVPMILGYLIAHNVFHVSMLNGLGSITGGMTSTPALGTLIATAGTDEVSSAYAATYPFALVSVVLAAKIIIMFL